MTARPTLIVISGPAGSGKTTLAHALAGVVGCPAICRDEIKEGMLHATGEVTAEPGDELTMRTLPTFFAVLQLLLGAGVTTIAEAAFQDRVWRPGLAPLRDLAHLRIVHCRVHPDVAWTRIQRRRTDNRLRRAHPDPHDATDHHSGHAAFDRLSIHVPHVDVDTTDGYRPTLAEIVAFLGQGFAEPWMRISRPR